MGWPKGKPRKVVLSPVAKAQLEQISTKPDEPVSNPQVKHVFSDPVNKWGMKSADWGTPGDYTPEEATVDRFDIPMEKLSKDLDYKWEITSILGKEEAAFVANSERNHWRIVHNKDFGGSLDGDFARRGSEDPVQRDGVVLMARPKPYSDKARQEEMRRAQEQANLKTSALMSGQMPGVTGATHRAATAANKIQRSYERIAVPDDE